MGQKVRITANQRKPYTRLCMRLVLMYARQPRPGPRPNRPSNGLLQGTHAIFLMYRYTTCFYVFGKKPKCHHYKKDHQHEHSNMPKYQANAKKTILFSARWPSQRVYSTKARTSCPEFFAQHKQLFVCTEILIFMFLFVWWRYIMVGPTRLRGLPGFDLERPADAKTLAHIECTCTST